MPTKATRAISTLVDISPTRAQSDHARPQSVRATDANMPVNFDGTEMYHQPPPRLLFGWNGVCSVLSFFYFTWLLSLG